MEDDEDYNNDGDQKEKEILFDRRVIDETLIRESVRVELLSYYEESTVPKAEELDLQEVKSLSLSFSYIYAIDNLQGFENLVKLQLDNNWIHEISNLDHLVNLEWLDLSFNKISEIKNLDKLVNLKDLSLFNNRIKKIEGLDTLTNLNVLSLGNNKIDDINYIKDLRQFKKLRLLNLKGNAVCKDPDYTNTVFAYLTSLKYLDYKAIEDHKFKKARDAKLDQLVDLEEKEKIALEEAKEVEEAEERKRKLVEANLGTLGTFFEEMRNEDKEYNKIKALPGFGRVWGEYRIDFERNINSFIQWCLDSNVKKKAEIALFKSVVNRVRTGAEKDSIDKIQAFDARKKKAFAAYEASVIQTADDEVVSNTQILHDLKKEVEVLSDDLMDIEMLLVEQLEDIIKEFEQNYGEFVTKKTTRINDTFRELLDHANTYGVHLRSLVDALLKEKQRREEEREAQGLDPNVPGENEDLEVLNILNNKDDILNAVQNSVDSHIQQIQNREDELDNREKKLANQMLTNERKEEMQRNRHRVSEIFQLMQRHIRLIDEKLEEHTQDAYI